MPRDMTQVPAASRVTALFEDEALFFPLPPDATFADLADCVAQVADRINSRAVAVTVRLNAPPGR